MKILGRPYATTVHRHEIVLGSVAPATPRAMVTRVEAMRLRDHRWVSPPGSIPEHDYCRTAEIGKIVTPERAFRH